MAFDPKELLSTREKIANRLGEQAGFDPQLLLNEPKKRVTDTVGEILANKFDPENFASTRIRLSLSRGDNIEEKNKRIKKFYPDGEVRVLPKSPVLELKDDVLVYRESPDQAFKLVEPEGFDITDIAESIAPSAESIAGETLTALATRGGSIPGLVMRMAGGAAGGEALEQGVQSARGVQAQTLPQIGGEVATEGGLSAAGGFAASPFVAAGNILKGRGALQVGRQGEETLRAARAIDPEIANRMTPGLVTDNPAMQLAERQAAALLPGLQRRYTALTENLDNAVKANIDTKTMTKVVDRVTGSLQDLSDTFLRQIKRTDSPMSAGGEALQKGIQEYDTGARQVINKLYSAARNVEEPQFDLSGFSSLAEELRAGAKGTLRPEVDNLLKEIEKIEGPIRLPSGETLSVTDQLRNVRTDAFALKEVPPGQVADQKTGQANDIFKKINETLDNPVNANPQFKELWSKANKTARDRFTTLEQAAVVQAAKSENPAELVSRFVRPGQIGHLRALRETVPKDKWQSFLDSAYSDLLSDPAKLSQRLNSFDQETLDVLMPRADQQVWKKIGKEMERINSVGADQIAERQVSNVNFIDSLVTSAEPRDAQTLIRAFNNTNDKAARDSIRASLLDWTWKDIVEQTPRGLKVDRNTLKGRIDMLKRNDLWRLLPKEVQELVGNAEIVARSFERVIDAGTSIQAAEAVKGLGRLQAGAIRSFIQSGIISHFYLSNMGRRILIGRGIPNKRGEALRLISAVLAQTSAPEDISNLEGRLDPATVQRVGAQ